MTGAMKHRAWLAASASALVIALVAPRAHADTKFGVGLIGLAGGNFIDKPSDTAIGGAPSSTFYPGFGGFTGGGGLMFDLRFLKLLGLEVDLMRTSDKGTGKVTLNGTYDVNFTIGQSATHVPVLAKLVIPAPIVAPMFVLGPEFVFPGSPSVEADKPLATPIDGVVNKYWMLTMGAGLEIKLPLPVVDLRIPILLRFSYNPKVSDKLVDRIGYNPTRGITAIGTEWKYVAGATLGAALYF